MSNSLNLNQDGLSILIWIQSDCQDHQQKTKVTAVVVITSCLARTCPLHVHVLTLCMLGNFTCFLLSSEFFPNYLFRKKYFKIRIIRVINSLDLDQDCSHESTTFGTIVHSPSVNEEGSNPTFFLFVIFFFLVSHYFFGPFIEMFYLS